MPARRGFARAQGGQVLPLMALTVFALLGMLALVTDVGYWRYQQRLEQAAADSAAIAGAIRLYYPTTPGASAPLEVTAAAQNAASANGFSDDGGIGNLTVTVNSPPSDSTPPRPSATPYPANSAVEVIVTKKQPVFFAGIFGQTNQPISARAVAAQSLDLSACLYQLADAAHGGEITVNGTSKQVYAVNCGIFANGPVNASISATSLGWYGPLAPNTNLNPGLIHQLPLPATDPCFKIRGCAYLESRPIPPIAQAIDAGHLQQIQAPAPPGYMVLTNCCPGNPQFGPGLYYIYGGITGAIHGTGVTIVNVDGISLINGQGRGTPDISAPQSFGPPDYSPSAGVAFYQPPSNTSETSDVTNNGVPAIWNGLYYAPTSYFRSNGQPDSFSFLVIGGIRINGKGITVNPAISPALADFNMAQFPTQSTLSE